MRPTADCLPTPREVDTEADRAEVVDAACAGMVSMCKWGEWAGAPHPFLAPAAV